ncbi:MAG: PH domain-containing protein [Pseudomonadota bacterium]|nr:PH domain-containing protein [Pseudomonadota bacterium]
MNDLSPAFKSVLRVRAAILAAILLVPALILDSADLSDGALPPFLISAAALALGALLIAVMPARHYRSWAYEVAPDELHVSHGLWFRSRTVVPFGRVQHIDLAHGPVERRFGVARLTLHTAGTKSGAVTLPGLAQADAERLRDDIRAKIQQDLV